MWDGRHGGCRHDQARFRDLMTTVSQANQTQGMCVLHQVALLASWVLVAMIHAVTGAHWTYLCCRPLDPCYTYIFVFKMITGPTQLTDSQGSGSCGLLGYKYYNLPSLVRKVQFFELRIWLIIFRMTSRKASHSSDASDITGLLGISSSRRAHQGHPNSIHVGRCHSLSNHVDASPCQQLLIGDDDRRGGYTTRVS